VVSDLVRVVIRLWWCVVVRGRTLEAAARAAEDGTPPLPRLSPAVRHSLTHHAHFVEAVSPEDVGEMRAALLSALEEASGASPLPTPPHPCHTCGHLSALIPKEE
jgi:hypothetical protein